MRYHLQRLCTWYHARFHALAYRGRGTRFTTTCVKRASGFEVVTTRTGSAVRSTASGTTCTDSTMWYRLPYFVPCDVVSRTWYQSSNISQAMLQLVRAVNDAFTAILYVGYAHATSTSQLMLLSVPPDGAL